MDHEAVQGLMSAVCEALKAHAEIEEKLFYPTVRPKIGDEELIDEAEVEHDSAFQTSKSV